MSIVVKIVGVVFILTAIVYLLKLDAMKRTLEFFKQGKRIYFAGLVRLVLAIVFLLAARECNVVWLIGVFGILFLVSGLLIFVLGPEKLKPWFEWWQKRSDLLLRVLSVIPLAIGAVIIYAA